MSGVILYIVVLFFVDLDACLSSGWLPQLTVLAPVCILVQSLQKVLDNNDPPIWIVNTKEVDICQSNLADSDRPSFMGITRHAGIEGCSMSRNLADFSWTASIRISSVTAILCRSS